MLRRLVPLALLCLIPTLAQPVAPATYPRIKAPGDLPPESYLPAESLIYVRFDGLEMHKKAYDQTAYAEVMKGDLGKFLEHGFTVLKDKVFNREDGPLAVLPAEQREKLLNSVPAIFEYFKNNGFVAAVEVIDLKAPRAQLTVVFPGGGDVKNRETLTGLAKLVCALAGIEIKEQKFGDRDVHTLVGLDPVKIAWWQEGSHLILTVGTESPEHTLKLVADRDARPNVTKHPLYDQISRFKGYETSCRGFADLENCIKHASSWGKEAETIVKGLGLDGLKHLTFHTGFEGKNCRTTMTLKTATERKGILKLMTGQKGIGLKDLPPVPPDAASISAMELDVGTLYDTVLAGIETVVGVVDKDALPEFQRGVKQMNDMIGIDLRKDLLGALGNRVVVFDSPSEGVLMTGTTVCIQVKDAKKLQAAIEKMCKSISEATGVQVTVKKRDYHGTELFSVHIVTGAQFVPGFPLIPSYAIHKDWWVVGLYPAPVQGTLLRGGGKTPAWKPSPLLEKVMSDAAKNPKAKVVSFSQVDPRPTLKFLLSFGPLVGGIIEMFAPGVLDQTMLPNAHAVCEPLFPNVYLTTDDGETIRYEGYASLALPFDAGGIVYYAAIMGVQFYGMRGPGFLEALTLPGAVLPRK